MNGKERIAVAMSGGVDSSVAAALLAEQGHQVFGLMMRLWQPGLQKLNRCCSPEDMALARRIAGILNIPFYVIDVQEIFQRAVVDFFANGYLKGITPNPCMECNRTIRWEFLLTHALNMGATYLATGHYAQVETRNGERVLLRALDRRKDQSYVLSVLSQKQLKHAVFPLGKMTKVEVREFASDLGLPVSDRPESQDLCFVAGENYRTFLEDYSGIISEPGPILDSQGKPLGSHTGLSGYTIGQRKGIGISAQTPLYVLEKDPSRNALIVGPESELGSQRFEASRINWISENKPEAPFRSEIQVRYGAPLADAEIYPDQENDRVEVIMDQPIRDVTPGQAVVMYQGDRCLGSGIIES